MNSNTGSIVGSAGLGHLAAAVEKLAAEDLTRLPDAEAAARVLALRRLLDRLEGQWLRELAAVDARAAAGAEHGTQAPSTAAWLRGRLRAGSATASSWVRMARALFRGPLAGAAQALAARGDLGAARRRAGRRHPRPASSNRGAGRTGPACGRRSPGPTAATAGGGPSVCGRRPRHRRSRPAAAAAAARPVGLPHFDGMVAIDGLLEPEAGTTLLAALEPLARPTTADDQRSGAQRRADALTELARRALESGRLPNTGGVRPSSPSPSSWPACSATPACQAATPA